MNTILRSRCQLFTLIVIIWSGGHIQHAVASEPDDQQPVFFESKVAFEEYYKSICKNEDPVYAYPTRLLPGESGKGKKFVVYVEKTRVDSVTIKETERDTRIATDIKSLMQKILGISVPAAAVVPDPLCGHVAQEYSVVLKLERSTLTLTATKQATPDEIAKRAKTAAESVATIAAAESIGVSSVDAAKIKEAAASAAPAASAAAANSASNPTTVAVATVVVGPAEHMFLSLDLPVSNRKTLKYDSANGGTLQPTDRIHNTTLRLIGSSGTF